MGKPGKIAGARELTPHESYRLAYAIEGGHGLGAGPGAYRPPVAAGAMREEDGLIDKRLAQVSHRRAPVDEVT